MTSPRLASLLSVLLAGACGSSQPAADGGDAGPADAPVVQEVAGPVMSDAADLAPVGDAPIGPDGSGAGDAPGATDLAIDGGTSATGCEKDLSGTWDLIASRPGEAPSTGVLVLDSTTFSVILPDKRLTYTAAGNKQAVWRRGTGGRVVAIQNTPGPPGGFNAGSVPLTLDGDWSFLGNTESCTMKVSSVLVSGSCQSSSGDFHVGGSDWPNDVPNPRNGGTYFATRSAPLPSQFGDLGGRWQAASVPPGPAGCEVTIQGNTLVATCHDAEAFNGTTSLVIGKDCVASGLSSGHFEISARRR